MLVRIRPFLPINKESSNSFVEYLMLNFKNGSIEKIS